jgi:hypothetical protein
MTTQPIDYAAILADLEAKRAAIDAAIVSVRAWLDAIAPRPPLTPRLSRAGEIIKIIRIMRLIRVSRYAIIFSVRQRDGEHKRLRAP